MQPHRRRWIYFDILLLLAGLAWIALSADPAGTAAAVQATAPQAGFLAPDFTLQTLEGGSATLAEMRGRVVLVNFWASWCPPCQAEMPAMQRLHEEYEARGLTVLAVNATYQDQQAEAARFIAGSKLTFTVPLDRDGETARRYNVRALPSSYFIGRDGVIREVVLGGPMSEALLRTRVERLLEEMP